MIYYYRVAETAIILCSAGSVVGLIMIARAKDVGRPSRQFAIILSLMFIWWLFGDLAFYLGNPAFAVYPVQQLVARFLAFLAIGFWLWRVRHPEKPRRKYPQL